MGSLLTLVGTLLAAPVGAGLASPAVAEPVVGVGEAAGPSPVLLPHKTYVNPDGSVEVVADKSAVAAARAAVTAGSDCGYYCDGKDPNSLLVVTPSGSFYCATDALTIYTKTLNANAYAELRFSRRCGTAWTRGCCYSRQGGFGYNASGTLRKTVSNYDGVYSGSPVWTAMLYDAGSLTYKACIDRVVAGAGNDWQCTTRL